MQTMASPHEFEALVEKELRDAHFEYVKQVVIGATKPDFIVKTDGGHRIVVEAKNWIVTSDIEFGRALHQAKTYKRLSNADEAVVVVAGVRSSRTSDALVTPISNLQQMIRNIARKLDKSRARRVKTRNVPIRKVFASMPFAPAFDDTYLVAIQPAALAVNALAERVDHNGLPGEVLPQIKKMIETSEVVIADLSGARPDVCYEVGFAEALKRPIIQICRTPIEKLPFSLRNNQTIHYAIGQTTKLREKLEKELRKLIG